MAIRLKNSLRLMALFLFPLVAGATSVTATITDSDSQTWNNCKWKVTLNNPRPDIVPAVSGVPLTASQITQTGSCNSSGVLSVTLVDNTTIDTVGTTWTFNVQPNASASGLTGSTAVSGSSQSLSTFLSGLAKGPRFNTGPQSYGYLDGEVTPLGPGTTYYNVTTPALRLWSGTAWSSIGSGGGLVDCTDTAGVSIVCTVPLTATQFLTGTGGGSLILSAVGASGYNILTFDGVPGAGATDIGIVANANPATDPNIYLDVPTGGKQTFRINGSVVGSVSATGLQGTGTQDIPQMNSNTPTAAQAVCIKAAGPPITLGTCSTVVSSSGACTCN